MIETISESLLETFRPVPLIDPYNVYQHLMDYWTEAMQDDAWQIALEGWKAVLEGKPNTDLIPEALIVARYFAADAAAIEQLEAGRDALSRRIEELVEEHSGEDGLLEEVKTDKGKLTAKSVKDRLKAIQGDKEAADEHKALEAYLALIEQEAAANKKLKDAQKALDAKVIAKYGQLSEAEIKALVVDDKWLAALAEPRAGRAGPREPGAHRAHQATRRALRHSATRLAAGGNAGRPRRQTPEEYGVRMDVGRTTSRPGGGDSGAVGGSPPRRAC